MRLRDERFCYLTTRGRRTGAPHEIEIWYASRGSTLYILVGDGERSDTVRNILADPSVTVRIGPRTFNATARVVSHPSEMHFARRAIPKKYAGEEEGLEEWAETALPVAIDLPLRPPSLKAS
jgi:deazaflavin-dependent oxidoreductase (nitroreductase family)